MHSIVFFVKPPQGMYIFYSNFLLFFCQPPPRNVQCCSIFFSIFFTSPPRNAQFNSKFFLFFCQALPRNVQCSSNFSIFFFVKPSPWEPVILSYFPIFLFSPFPLKHLSGMMVDVMVINAMVGEVVTEQ